MMEMIRIIVPEELSLMCATGAGRAEDIMLMMSLMKHFYRKN